MSFFLHQYLGFSSLGQKGQVDGGLPGPAVNTMFPFKQSLKKKFEVKNLINFTLPIPTFLSFVTFLCSQIGSEEELYDSEASGHFMKFQAKTV